VRVGGALFCGVPAPPRRLLGEEVSPLGPIEANSLPASSRPKGRPHWHHAATELSDGHHLLRRGVDGSDSEATPAAKRGARQNVIARMGVDTDTAIARELGVSISAIAQRRRRLGIARAPDARLNGFPWTRAADALLGEVPDREVASELGISLVMVERRRLALDLAGANGRGIGRRKQPAKIAGAKYIKAYRAGARVADLARKHGRSTTAVRRALARYLRRVESDRSPRRRRARAPGVGSSK
jgi:hypothetical protein